MKTTIYKPPPVIITYDAGRYRRSKRFTNVFEARRFYLKKLQTGKNPTIRKA